MQGCARVLTEVAKISNNDIKQLQREILQPDESSYIDKLLYKYLPKPIVSYQNGNAPISFVDDEIFNGNILSTLDLEYIEEYSKETIQAFSIFGNRGNLYIVNIGICVENANPNNYVYWYSIEPETIINNCF